MTFIFGGKYVAGHKEHGPHELLYFYTVCA
jgi:hypothetical protein